MRKSEEAESLPIPVTAFDDPTKGDFVLEHDANGQQIITPLRQAKWRCFVPDCMRDVALDAHFTLFDDRYATGTCQTHGHVPLVRVP
jgi:hypothetical protein